MKRLKKIGLWSQSHLASIALEHYFPHFYQNEEDPPSIEKEMELIAKMGMCSFAELITKYDDEVGFTDLQLSDDEVVNEN